MVGDKSEAEQELKLGAVEPPHYHHLTPPNHEHTQTHVTLIYNYRI